MPFVIIVLFMPKGKVWFVDALFTFGCFYNNMEILLLKKKKEKNSRLGYFSAKERASVQVGA